MNKDSTVMEKLALLALAGITLAALFLIAIDALSKPKIDSAVAGLLGAIVGYLAGSSKDIIATIRSYSTSAQLGKVTDQLAASAPVVEPPPTDPNAPPTDPSIPQKVEVTNQPDKPVPTEVVEPVPAETATPPAPVKWDDSVVQNPDGGNPGDS